MWRGWEIEPTWNSLTRSPPGSDRLLRRRGVLKPPSATATVTSRSRLVLVAAPPPHRGLVAPLGRTVQPLVHAPEPVEAARVGRVGVVDDAVLEGARAHPRPLACERRGVGAG